LWPKIGIFNQGNSKLANVLSVLVKAYMDSISSDDLHFVGDTRMNFAWQEGVRLASRDGISF